MAQFTSGQKKPNGSGRRPGTKNKRSEHLSEVLASIDINVPEELMALIPELKPEKRADVLLELMGYLYPKRKALEAMPPKNTDNQIDIYFVDPDGTKTKFNK